MQFPDDGHTVVTERFRLSPRRHRLLTNTATRGDSLRPPPLSASSRAPHASPIPAAPRPAPAADRTRRRTALPGRAQLAGRAVRAPRVPRAAGPGRAGQRRHRGHPRRRSRAGSAIGGGADSGRGGGGGTAHPPL